MMLYKFNHDKGVMIQLLGCILLLLEVVNDLYILYIKAARNRIRFCRVQG
jgi:hypothetical protein